MSYKANFTLNSLKVENYQEANNQCNCKSYNDGKSFLRLKERPKGYKTQPVLFLDLDNTLYPKSIGLSSQLRERIILYFETFLGIPPGESSKLGQRYFLDYGLAIRGLLKDFQIDPQEYDRFVDGGLELETKLHPDPSLKNMLQNCTARLFIFTNAGIYHAKRVLQLLGIYDLFEGILYCDYCEADFPSKPERAAFERAMSVAQIEDVKKQRVYFVDDSVNNVNGGLAIGWESILVDEFLDVDVEILNNNNAVVDSSDNLKGDDEKERRIRTIHELPIVLPELF